MTKDVHLLQDVPVVSGHGPQMTQQNGDLLMPCAAVNLVVARRVPNQLLTISPMEMPAAVFRTKTVPMSQDARAAIGLGLL